MKRTVSKILGTLIAVNVRTINKIIRSSIWYKLVIFLAMGYFLIGEIWNIFFHDDFMARTTLWIILLVAIAWILLSKVLNAIAKEGKKLMLDGG